MLKFPFSKPIILLSLLGTLSGNRPLVKGDDEIPTSEHRGTNTEKNEQPAGLIESDRIRIANGSVVVCRKTDSSNTDSVLIHFHGDVGTVGKALLRSRFDGHLAVVNFPGLSSAYAKPFADEPQLLDQIPKTAWEIAHGMSDNPGGHHWKSISVSSFSAGYGAIRELRKSDQNAKRITAIVTADSIYAAHEKSSEDRRVDAEHMRGFLKFAQLATTGEKRFVLSHSAQATPYASTTETADYLLRSLGIPREPDAAIQRDGFRQSTRATQGRFVVLGFEGTSGRDHLRNLHNIDLVWDLCFAEEPLEMKHMP